MSASVNTITWTRGLVSAATALALLLGGTPSHARGTALVPSVALPAQTDVDRAIHLFDAEGVPMLQIDGRGKQRHPAWIALYALAYAGVEAYEAPLIGIKDKAKFDASINWLSHNLKQHKDGLWVWEYGFDSTYNDISIKAPWSSAFAQATGIQALLAAWRADGKSIHLDQAIKASKALFTPLAKGGFLFQQGEDIWFEEIPAPTENPGHILNGHMRVLLALKELAVATGDKAILAYYRRGKDTLLRWLPRFDSGYWLRYDLNPRKQELLFRIVNPYGFTGHALAVDRITLRDPISGKASVLDVGEASDATGSQRIAGLHWGQPAQISGRSVRRLAPMAMAMANSATGSASTQSAPHTYFYLSLPDGGQDNLRRQDYELELEYLDDAPANLTIQQRSIAPGTAFRDMRDGDLHLTGSGKWRTWRVPLRTTDLGWWVGTSYADKHARYLKALSKEDERFVTWSKLAATYQNDTSDNPELFTKSTRKSPPTPEQTGIVPFWSLGKDGVVRFHVADENSRFDLPGNQFNPASSIGHPVDSPYAIAEQLSLGPKMPGLEASPMPAGRIQPERVTREAALKWFLDPHNQVRAHAAITYPFKFRNVYNDIVSAAPWASAFSQAYVLRALGDASERYPNLQVEIQKLIRGVVQSFVLDSKDGGITAYDRAQLPFFEEVPNGSHILNAHLVSINELVATSLHLGDPSIRRLSDRGVEGLRTHLYQFDTGYWMRYDQNPRKELMLQFDWLDGASSPLIESIKLRNPSSLTETGINVGSPSAFEGAVHLSGTDWLSDEQVEGRRVRAFRNGYALRKEPVEGGARHNVFFVGRLPSVDFADPFDVPAHQLVIHYKDVAAGEFAVKIQAIHEGNSLQFVPLRGGVLTTTGDQNWKEAVFTIRPQDLGWYKGPDYQNYEVEQLKRIANLTEDWFFSQYAERQAYFLLQQKLGRAVIIEPANTAARPAPKLLLRTASTTYPGHGFANALDGDPNNDYVAGIENQVDAQLEFTLDPAISPVELRITWESPSNFAKKVMVYAQSGEGEAEALIGEAPISSEPITRIPLKSKAEVQSIRVVFSQFTGQPRLLLRLLEIH